ncbi:protein transport protein SFT2-like [Lucilia sericata]|uniref:protein transport protein SFT2-like n=1 Tax=Lucilia sericata TaxID=13632 RepID=UPI0018A80219|nr:protein transport protein SFT2-like [Lucilia sericata]
MANLKDDLDQYLLLQSDQKKKFNVKVPQLKVPEFGNIFSRNTEPEANSWLKETQDSCCPKLSRLQRIVGFVACLGMGTLCMTISMFYIPLLLLKTRKFSLLYTMGSLFFILSFCFLSGFMAFFRTLFTKERALVSSAYFSCLFATLYCALWAQSTALTVLFALLQMIALAFMVISTVPGGSSGIKLFGSLFKSSVSSSGSSALPV